MKLTAIILSLTFFNFASAQVDNSQVRDLLLENQKNSEISGEDLQDFPEIYRFRDSILQDKSSTSGLVSDPYYTRNDNSRFSFSIELSLDYQDLTKIQSIQGVYLNQFNNSFRNLWWGVQFKRTTGKYDALADQRVSTSGDSNSVANKDRNDNLQSFSSFGGGIAHRFKTLQEVFDSHRIFEFISVFFNYNFHQDSTDDELYNGIGYTAEYSLTYRSSKKFFYGAKVSYNWAMVERPQVDEEDLPDRSLVFGWTTFGMEIGYFF